MGYCSCGNWVDEGDICSHCGGSGGADDSYDEDEELDQQYISRDEYFYRQAKSCSIKGDHSTAIGFYQEAFKESVGTPDKLRVLSYIAEEYEKMGDFASAEEYWTRCCTIDDIARPYLFHQYATLKGDFLYRRCRYREAIVTYEEALNALKAMDDRNIDMVKLKYYAKIVHYIISSYGALLDDSHNEKYHAELRQGIDRYLQISRTDNENKAYSLCETAWQIYADDGLVGEALIFMDCAFELNPDCTAGDYNRKAILLYEDNQFDEALKYFDKALSKESSNETFLKNKAECIRGKLKFNLLFGRVKSQELDLINEALKILPEKYDSGSFLTVKGEILDFLGDPLNAKVCYALAAKRYAEVDEAERQLKKLDSGETYINITGIYYYKGLAPFREGSVVSLIKEPDNPHDRNAIRVEINGETVGYVANSRHTVIKQVKSATELKNTNLTRAEVQFILFGEWVIAKLI